MPTARKVKALKSAKTNRALDNLLKNVVEGKDLLKLQNGATLFAQGEEGDAIYLIQTGKVQLTVVSSRGKVAVLARLGPRDFLGEGCLVGNSRRTSTATSLQLSTVFRIEKRAMLQALHDDPKFSEEFVTSLLARNINLEADLCDQLFNHGEKRLARVLLKLARLRESDIVLDANIPVLSHEILAELVGTTRSRITHFMNKFRTMGLIDYNGELTVRTELLTDLVLND